MAICAAFNSPEVEVIGLTTIFGNVFTPTATENAFILLKLVGEEKVRRYTILESCSLPTLALAF